MQFITNQTPFLFYDTEDVIADEGSVASMFGLPAGSAKRVARSGDMGLVYQITPQKDTIEFDGTYTVYFVSGKCVMEFSESATIPRAAFDMVVLGKFDIQDGAGEPFVAYFPVGEDTIAVRAFFPGSTVVAMDGTGIGASVFRVTPTSANVVFGGEGTKYLWTGGLKVAVTANIVPRSCFEAVEVVTS